MKSINLLLCVMCVCVLSGCACFEGKLLEPVDKFPTALGDERPSAQIELNFRQYHNGAPVTLFSKTAENNLEKKCIKRFTESGLYSHVGTDVSDPDLKITIDLADDGQGSMGMAVLTGLTFYLIPSFATDTYKLKAEVLNCESGEKEVIELEDFVTQWQQILLLPILPFKMTPVVASGVQDTLFDHLAIEAVN